MPKYAKVSQHDKIRLVECYQKGGDFVELAGQLNVKRTTAYSIVRRFIENDGREKQRGGARRWKMSQEIKDTIVSIAWFEYTMVIPCISRFL